MNIAIIVAVSNYEHAAKLPACSKDAKLIYDLLSATGKYGENTLYLLDDCGSASIKEKIVDFVSKYKNQSVEEVFFYYSGHGQFTGDEFYYLLSDFQASQRNQTSIANSELDSWLRSLNPQLTIKVVDACQAGVQYIKDSQTLNELFQKSASSNSLGNCYFMYSSLQEQYSYQDSNLSFFTKSFAAAVYSFKSTQIRYKDIVDYISDYFHDKSEQTPFFVVQATNTEVFCAVSPELKDVINRYISKIEQLQQVATQNVMRDESKFIVDLVVKDAENYCTLEEVQERFSELKELVENYQFSKDFALLYDVTVEFLSETAQEIPKVSTLGKWLEENDNNYFAEPAWGKEAYEVEVPLENSYNIIALAVSGQRTKTVTKWRNIITGMRVTQQDVPYKMLRLKAAPKYENIRYHECYIAFVFSKTELRFFYYYAPFKELNWNDRKSDHSEDWRTTACPIKSLAAISIDVEVILNGFTDFIMKPIKDRYIVESENIQSQNSKSAATIKSDEPVN